MSYGCCRDGALVPPLLLLFAAGVDWLPLDLFVVVAPVPPMLLGSFVELPFMFLPAFGSGTVGLSCDASLPVGRMPVTGLFERAGEVAVTPSVRVGASDLTYETSCKSCSSVACP